MHICKHKRPALSRPAQFADRAPGHRFTGVAGREGAGAGWAQAYFAQDVVEGAGVGFGVGPVRAPGDRQRD